MGAGRATCVIPANTTPNYRGVGPLLRGPPPGTKSGDASRPSGGGGAGFGQGPGFGGGAPGRGAPRRPTAPRRVPPTPLPAGRVGCAPRPGGGAPPPPPPTSPPSPA